MKLNIDIKQLFQSLQSVRDIDVRQILRRTDLLINISIIIIALISLRVMYQKQTTQIKSLKAQLKEVEGTTDLMRKIEVSEQEMGLLLKKLPIGKDFPDIINTVTNIAKSNNIEINSISQSQKKYAQHYYTLPLSLTIRGSYYDIWNFLRGIENAQDFFTLEDARIGGPQASLRFRRDKESSYCSAEIKLSATSIKQE